MATNGHARPAAPRATPYPEPAEGAEYLVIVHPAGDLDAPHLARYWTEVPALSACTAAGATIDQAVENTRAAIMGWLAGQAPFGAVGAFRLAVELAF